MSYTAATQLPALSLFAWSRPSSPNPRLSAPIGSTDTTLTFTSAPQDKDGAVISAAFLMGVKNSDSFTELIYVPAGAMSVDGLTATAVVRGIRIDGLDYTTGDTDFADEHEQDSPVFCSINAVYAKIVQDTLQGTVATGGSALRIGDETDTDVDITAALAADLTFLRYDVTGDKAQYSNDGITFNDIDDVVAGNLTLISAADTTPGYAEDKITAGTNVTITKNGTGADESLELSAAASNAEVDNDYTASEGIAAGAPVSVSGTDEVENFVISELDTAGTESTFEANSVYSMSNVYVSGDKVAALYVDSAATDWYIVVGTVDVEGTTTWGTRVLVNSYGNNSHADMAYIEDDKIVIIYSDDDNDGLYARIVTISGTVPTLGTASVVHNNIAATSRAFGVTLIDTDKLIVAYEDGADGRAGKAKAATFTGTTIGTWGSAAEFESGATIQLSVVKFDTDKAGVFYRDDDDTDKGKGCLLVATGTALSAAVPVLMNDAVSYNMDSVRLEANKALVVYYDTGATETQAIVASLSGLTISYGSEVTVNSLVARTISVDAIDSATAFVSYEETGASDGRFNKLSISGTVITVGSQYTFNGSVNDVYQPTLSRLSDKDKFIICYADGAAAAVGNAEVFQDYDNADSVVGLAQSTVSVTDTVTVRSKGLDSNQTGLTAGTKYYLKTGGVESTNNSGIAAGVAKDTTVLDIDIDPDTGMSKDDADTLTDGSDANALHIHGFAIGVNEIAVATTSDTENINHGLSETPTWLKITAFCANGDAGADVSGAGKAIESFGSKAGATYATIWHGSDYDNAGDNSYVGGVSTSSIIYLRWTASATDYVLTATVVLTATQIQLTFTNGGAAQVVEIQWECGV